MTNYQKGYSYEEFVQTVYNAILEAENDSQSYNSIEIERRKKIISKSGTEAEIDIYWEFEQASISHAVAIECKNENRNVGIAAVRNFARKISDLSGLKGLIVSSKGFSNQAIMEAKADQIDLLVIRPQENKDWEGYIKEIQLNMNFQSSPRIRALRPFINKEWMSANGYSKGDTIKFSVMPYELIIEDKLIDFRESIQNLMEKGFFKPNQFGQHTWSHDFEDGWLLIEKRNSNENSNTKDERYKIDRMEIDYIQPTQVECNQIIDFSENVLAVIESISGKSGKELVLKSGIKNPFE